MQRVCPTSRRRSTVARFLREEDGSATIWNLMWLSAFAIMGGLAIDSTNAWRHKTMLASTADVAALAGAWDLPEDYLKEPYTTGGYADVEGAALRFAGENMEWGQHGSYMQGNDVYVGHWDKTTRTFTWGENFSGPNPPAVNAVQVWLGQNEENGNRVQTTLLRFLGINEWDINTTATAMYGVNECYFNGAIGREGFRLESNATILTDACLHGQLRVDIQPNGTWRFPKTLTTGLSPSDTVGTWDVKDAQYDVNGQPIDMSAPQKLNLYPPMVDQIPTIGRNMLNGTDGYRHFTYPAQDPAATAKPEVVVLPGGFNTVDGTYDPDAENSSHSGQIEHAWWRTEDAVQVASLDGFASVIGLLGASHHRAGHSGGGGSGDVSGGPAGGDPVTNNNGETWRYSDPEVTKQGNTWQWPLDEPMALTDAGLNAVSDASVTTNTAPLAQHRIYFAESCQAGKLTLTGDVRNVTIVTNCKIDIAKDTVVANSVLLTTDDSTQSVQISNGAQIGAACQNWGGVRIYANGRVTASANGNNTDSQFYGAQIVTRGDIHFAAKSDSSKGLSLLAGGEIKIEANAKIGALELPSNPSESDCPTTEAVGPVFTAAAYEPALVD